MLGAATLLASIAAFALLLAGLWTNMDEWGSESVWRTFGCVAILGIVGSHACLLLGALRRGDPPLVRGLIPLAGLVDDIDEPWPRIFGAVLVLLVLTSVLPPIVRRMQPAARPAPSENAITRIADRIEALNGDPGNRAPRSRQRSGA